MRANYKNVNVNVVSKCAIMPEEAIEMHVSFFILKLNGDYSSELWKKIELHEGLQKRKKEKA